MDFIRAHGEEQKQIRIQQIIDATAALYDEVGYDKVTFSKIGRKVNFTRINLYNYFKCKEDIFLLLLEQDIWKMAEDAERSFTEKVTDPEVFCVRWAEFMLRHQRMLALFSIVNTVILRDANGKAHEQFRINMNRSFLHLRDILEKIFPEMPREKVMQFVEFQNSYAMTLFPASIEYKELQHIPIYKDAGFGTRHFIPQYIPFLKVILEGLAVHFPQ